MLATGLLKDCTLEMGLVKALILLVRDLLTLYSMRTTLAKQDPLWDFPLNLAHHGLLRTCAIVLIIWPTHININKKD
jgi:hypothetical protein